MQVCIDCYKKAYSRAIATAQKLLNTELSDRDRTIIYRLLASAFYKTGKLTEALDYVNRGLAIDSQNYMLLYHRAIIYYSLQKKDLAIAYIDSAVTLIPNEDLRESLLQLKQQLSN